MGVGGGLWICAWACFSPLSGNEDGASSPPFPSLPPAYAPVTRRQWREHRKGLSLAGTALAVSGLNLFSESRRARTGRGKTQDDSGQERKIERESGGESQTIDCIHRRNNKLKKAISTRNDAKVAGGEGSPCPPPTQDTPPPNPSGAVDWEKPFQPAPPTLAGPGVAASPSGWASPSCLEGRLHEGGRRQRWQKPCWCASSLAEFESFSENFKG